MGTYFHFTFQRFVNYFLFFKSVTHNEAHLLFYLSFVLASQLHHKTWRKSDERLSIMDAGWQMTGYGLGKINDWWGLLVLATYLQAAASEEREQHQGWGGWAGGEVWGGSGGPSSPSPTRAHGYTICNLLVKHIVHKHCSRSWRKVCYIAD